MKTVNLVGVSVVGIGVFLILASCCYGSSAFDVYLENDSRLLKPNGNSDRHYTNGVKFVFTTDNLPSSSFLDCLGGWGFEDEFKSKAGVFFGQNIYTPDYIDRPDLRRAKDMSYAGWLYTGVFTQRNDARRFEHTELNFGVIGPSALGRQSQGHTHSLLDSTEAIGWDDQIGDEFAFDFTYQIREKLDFPVFSLPENFDFMTEYGFTAGSVHRHAELGFILRWGVNLAGDFGPGRLELPVSSALECHGNLPSYLYLRVNGRAVEHNRFMTGLSEKPLVGSLQLGLMSHYKSLSFGYAQTFFTKEFKEQDANDSIGALFLSWNF